MFNGDGNGAADLKPRALYGRPYEGSTSFSGRDQVSGLSRKARLNEHLEGLHFSGFLGKLDRQSRRLLELVAFG